MPITWPAAPFPQKLLVEGYQEQTPNIVVRTKMDAGPPKVRKRFTAGIRPITGSLDLTAAQVATLDTFVMTTLKGGVETFDWTHPRTGAAASFKIVPPVTYTAMEPDVWRASLSLELQP